MEKYHKTDICPVENENERDETYEASNPQIDSERTKDNYRVIGRCGTYTEFINKRIDELDLPTEPSLRSCRRISTKRLASVGAWSVAKKAVRESICPRRNIRRKR